MLLQTEVENKTKDWNKAYQHSYLVQVRPRLGQSCICKNALKLEHVNVDYIFENLPNI